MLAGLLITMGAIGDRIGRRRLLMLGAVGFGAASVLAAYAPSAELLIAAMSKVDSAASASAPNAASCAEVSAATCPLDKAST